MDVTPETCYTKAADLLMMAGVTPEHVVIAAEWRKLGDTLWDKNLNDHAEERRRGERLEKSRLIIIRALWDWSKQFPNGEMLYRKVLAEAQAALENDDV